MMDRLTITRQHITSGDGYENLELAIKPGRHWGATHSQYEEGIHVYRVSLAEFCDLRHDLDKIIQGLVAERIR